MVVAVFEYKGCNRGCDERHFATWKAVVARTLKPFVGIRCLARARSREDMLHRLGGDCPKRRRIHRLPEGLAQRIVTAKPERSRQFGSDRAVLDCLLNVAVPNTAFIERDDMVETGMDHVDDDKPTESDRERISVNMHIAPS